MTRSDTENTSNEHDGMSDTNGITWSIGSTAASEAAWGPEEGIVNPELPRVTCEELKQLIDQQSDVIVVDAGMENHYRKGHIVGAVLIPADPLPPFTEEFTLTRISMLPLDKLIVTYCDWEDDSESASLALKILESGFEADRVKVLRKGWARWVELGYPTERRAGWEDYSMRIKGSERV